MGGIENRHSINENLFPVILMSKDLACAGKRLIVFAPIRCLLVSNVIGDLTMLRGDVPSTIP